MSRRHSASAACSDQSRGQLLGVAPGANVDTQGKHQCSAWANSSGESSARKASGQPSAPRVVLTPSTPPPQASRGCLAQTQVAPAPPLPLPLQMGSGPLQCEGWPRMHLMVTSPMSSKPS